MRTRDDGLYLAHLHLDAPRTLAIGALGEVAIPAGDLVYVGSARQGRGARLARHRRAGRKKVFWHIDRLRPHCRWLEARLVDDPIDECALAAKVAALPGASRPVRHFGASDCRCPGHLVHFAEAAPPLPGVRARDDGHDAHVLVRHNRFVADVDLGDGEPVRAYVPNTARLPSLLAPRRPVLVQPTADRDRKTSWTVTHAWDDTWVNLAATHASAHVAMWLAAGNPIPGLGQVRDLRGEVRHGDHRLDFEVTLADGRVGWLEVKSTTRAADGAALLSRTPSTRGVAHLGALSRLAREGVPTAAVFVAQRGDVRRLSYDAESDPGWVTAVNSARAAGVTVFGLGCRVTPGSTWVDRVLD